MRGALRRVACDAGGVAAAAAAIIDGRVVAFPTDTVYAIGCDARNAAAVAAVNAAKSRDASRPMPVLCGSEGSAWEIARPCETARRLAAAFWPGALTMVLPLADARVGSAMGLRDGTVGVRVPDSACALSLLRACGPLVGTSANASGREPAVDAGSVRVGGVDVVVDGGPVGAGRGPSTVVGLAAGARPEILREGALGRADVEAHWT